MRPVAVIDVDLAEHPTEADARALARLAHQHGAAEVVILPGAARDAGLATLARACSDLGMGVAVRSTLGDAGGALAVEHVGPVPLVRVTAGRAPAARPASSSTPSTGCSPPSTAAGRRAGLRRPGARGAARLPRPGACSASAASAATGAPSTCSSSARCARPTRPSDRWPRWSTAPPPAGSRAIDRRTAIGTHHAPHVAGRAAAVAQRPARRHVAGRPAPRAPRVRRALQRRHRPLRRAPPR